MDKKYPIKIVARKTGLTPHAIRAWEKRYGTVSPARTPNNRRFYSEGDVERLLLLKKAIRAGYSIGQIAGLPTEKLSELISSEEALAPKTPKTTIPVLERSVPLSHFDSCIDAVRQLDVEALESALMKASVDMSNIALIEKLIVPMMRRIGDLWREGSLSIACEHFSSAVIRTFLGSMRGSFQTSKSDPKLVIGTPSGQFHELGAFISSVAAASEGWKVIYLGSNLPAEEIARVAKQSHAKAVALSIVYPADDPGLVYELKKLRRLLSGDETSTNVVLIAGGSAAYAYGDTLRAIGAEVLNDMQSLRVKLGEIRHPKV